MAPVAKTPPPVTARQARPVHPRRTPAQTVSEQRKHDDLKVDNRDAQSARNNGLSVFVISLLVLVGVLGVCSTFLAFMLMARQPKEGAIAKDEATTDESQLNDAESAEIAATGDAGLVKSQNQPEESLPPGPAADTSPVVKAPRDFVPPVLSTLFVGNELGYSISVRAEVAERRHKVATGMGIGGGGGGMGMSRGRGSGRQRFRGGGGMGAGLGGGTFGGGPSFSQDQQSDIKTDDEEATPTDPEVIRWEGLASYRVSRKTGRRRARGNAANEVTTCGFGFPGRLVLVSPHAFHNASRFWVHINNQQYDAVEVPSGAQSTFRVLKVADAPADFKMLPASSAGEIYPSERFEKSVWNSAWRDEDGALKMKRAVSIITKSNSHQYGAVCWRDTGKIGGVSFGGYFVPAKTIQDILPEHCGTVFDFDVSEKRGPNYGDIPKFESQIFRNLVEVTAEVEGKKKDKVESKDQAKQQLEEIQIDQNFYLGQFADVPYGPSESPDLRGPIVFKSSRFWNPVKLKYVEGSYVQPKSSSAPSPPMPLLLPSINQIVFQDLASVSSDRVQDALFTSSGKVNLLGDGQAQNVVLEAQFRIGKYRTKVTNVEKGADKTRVFRKTTIATTEEKMAPNGPRAGRASIERKYMFPMRIERDEVFEFDNRTGAVQSVEFTGTISQGPGAKRQATVPFTMKIEKTTSGSPVLVHSETTAKTAASGNEKLPLTTKVRDRIVRLLTSSSRDNRVKGLELLHLYAPRREPGIDIALRKTLDNSYWGSNLIYELASQWIYNVQIQDLLKDAVQRNDFQEKVSEQQTLLFLMEKFPERAYVGSIYNSLFKGLLRSINESVVQETIRILTENYPKRFEEIILATEMFKNPDRKPDLAVIETLGRLGTKRTIDELRNRVDEINTRTKRMRKVPRKVEQRLKVYEAAIEQIEARTNGRRR